MNNYSLAAIERWKRDKKLSKTLCMSCGISFQSYPKRGRKFCSRLCFVNSVQLGIPRTEETKRKIRETHANRDIFRSSTIGKRIRGTIEYRQWRSDIFRRDDYTCQICFVRGGCLNADHIKPLHWIIFENQIETISDAAVCEELWDLNNGQTLCVNCHRKTDTYGTGSRVVK